MNDHPEPAAHGSCKQQGLILKKYPVQEVCLGRSTDWSAGTLQVNAEEMKKLLVQESGLRRVGIAVANPGDSTRIVNILDAVEPRAKPPGNGEVFPGFLGSMDSSVGRGVTHTLEGSAVVVCGSVPGQVSSQLVSEAMVDMSGPGADYSPFAKTCNIVLLCDFFDDQGPIKRVSVARYAGLLAAQYLAKATLELTPACSREYALQDNRHEKNDLPRVVYICPGMILSDLHQTFLAGSSLTSTPTVISPTQLMDGIIVSGNYDIGSTRNPTYMYQHCPIVEELCTRHDQGDLIFSSVIISKCLIETSDGKQRSATLAAQAAKLLGADGAVISVEECGHAYADLMLTCQACEELGLSTVLLMAESAGATGAKSGPIAYVNAADAIISVGNMDESIPLPAVHSVLGGNWPCGRFPLDIMASEAMSTPLANVFAATCQMGPSTLKGETR
jgi:glycine reductase